MESELIKEKEKFQALFEYASMGIVVTNAQGQIQMVNRYLLSQFGYASPEELLGRRIEVLIPARYTDKHQQYRESYNQHPGHRSMGVGRDLYALKQDGSEFPVEVSLSNYNTTDGMFVIAFVIDITKRKEIEHAVIEQKEQLEASKKQVEELNNELELKVNLRTSQLQDAMELIQGSRDELTKALDKEKELGDLKSRFVAMASHEFRTPLSTILSSASLLAKYTESAEQEKRDKHIDRIKGSVMNLTGILNEFLSIGRIEDGKIEVRYKTFNVKDFITHLCLEMQVQVKQGQKIIYNHSGNEEIHLDESLLRNILFNLLSNAIKFSHQDGEIMLETNNSEAGFVISVTDSGIGISAEDQEHLFERFFRAGNATNIQGTGLGLHIVSRYVQLLNGDITCKSELEKGTNFTIHFDSKQQ